MDKERREFLIQLGTVTVAAPALFLLTGCQCEDIQNAVCLSSDDDDDSDDDDSGDDDSSDDDDSTPCIPGDAEGPSNVHGHQLSIPASHLEDPLEDRTYTSTGGSHVHTFTVASSQLQELRENCSFLLSTSLPHAHTWDITVT